MLQSSFFLSALIAFLCVSFLSSEGILYTFIVFGQAHFLIAYFYKNKVGGIDGQYIRRFLVLAILLGIICSYAFFSRSMYPVIIFVTLIAFVLHYFNDELRLRGFAMRNQLFGAIAIALSFSSVFAMQIFSLQPIAVYVLGVASVCMATLFIWQVTMQKIDNFTKYQLLTFFLLNIIVPIYLAIDRNIDIYTVSGFIIFFHYVRWYLYYGERFEGEELNFYLKVVFWSHVLIILSFAMYALAPRSGILYIFFSPIFFYGWTLIHIILSLRKEDYLTEKYLW